MRTLVTLVFCLCLIVSCGSSSTEYFTPSDGGTSTSSITNTDGGQNKQDSQARQSITFSATTNCVADMERPYLIFVDMFTGEMDGPFKVNTSVDHTVSCIPGHPICWGAWIGKANYYDCSQAEQTHECYLVDWNPDFMSWGCTRNCYEYSKWNCYNCNDQQTVKHIYLNCGDIQ